jgi:hypothetical protein
VNSWHEERLYVLNMIEDLKAEQRRQSESAAAARAKVEEKSELEQAKSKRDIQAAHEKIRALERTNTILTIKKWVMSLILGAAGAIAIELIKFLLSRG